MRTVNFRDDILYPIAHILGVNPKLDLNVDHAAAWCSFVNSRTRQAWEFWDWSELKITEERAFRTIWNASRVVNVGEEVFYCPTFSYFQCIAQPPIGTLPTDTTYYTPVTLDDYYIALDQTGRRPLGQVFGVFASNPRTVQYPANCSLGFRPSEKGIDVNPAGSNGLSAWVNYRLKPSEFTVEPYDPTHGYHTLDKIYWTDGQVYESLQPSTGEDPGVPGYWRLVPMPWIFSEFVSTAAAGDACDDLQNSQLLSQSAMDMLTRQVDMLAEQGQKYYYKRPQWCGYWSYAPWGFVFTGSTDSTLTDEDDDLIPDSVLRLPTLETGTTAIPQFQAWVDVVFVTPKTLINYHFAELVVEWTGTGPPPFIIRAELVDNRTLTGFRAVLNGGPPVTGYVLKWRVTS
jgi:hypothetical protein